MYKVYDMKIVGLGSIVFNTTKDHSQLKIII